MPDSYGYRVGALAISRMDRDGLPQPDADFRRPLTFPFVSHEASERLATVRRERLTTGRRFGRSERAARNAARPR